MFQYLFLDTLDEPEAKSAMIWIIGEYADRIDNSDELLEVTPHFIRIRKRILNTEYGGKSMLYFSVCRRRHTFFVFEHR